MAESVYFRGFDSFSVPETGTIIEQSVARLRNAIMQGELRPGQKLIEAELCRNLNVSRASLREALRALESEKLIELVPNRGPSVAKLDYQDVEAIHEVWALLTSEAVADFTRNAKPRDIADLDKAVNALKESIATNVPLGQLGATNSFFATIMRRCGNSVLADMVGLLVARVNFLRAQSLLQGWGILYAREIDDIITAIRDGNAEAARMATRKHISSVCAAGKQISTSPELAPAKKRRSPSRTTQPGKPKRARAA